ncbi:ABC transporter substrate-binding protein [bacterium]|nr:ABC transporter substrate-binding protein [bacterium]
MKIKLIALAFLLLFAGPVVANEVIRVAVIGAKSGSTAIINSTMFRMARILVADLNKNGGVIGKKIDLIELDNRGTPLGSGQAAEIAVKSDVTAVIGAIYSSNSLAMAPIFQKAGIPMISPSSTATQLTLIGNYIFRVCYTDMFQGEVMAQFAREQFGAKKVMVITNTDSRYSIGLAKVFIENFIKMGGEKIWEEDYLDKITNLNQLNKRIIQLNPDLIFLPGHPLISAKIIRNVRRSGNKIVFLGGDGMTSEMYHYAGKELDGNYFSNHWHRDDPNRKSREMIKKFGPALGVISQASSALTYDAIMILVDAITKANSLNRGDIRDALAKTKGFEGATGVITFDTNGDPRKQAVIFKLRDRDADYFKTILPK